MKLHILAASAAAAMIVSPAVALAQVEQGRWSFSLEAGADFPVDGDLNGGRNVAIPDAGVIDPDFAGEAFILRVNPVQYEDVYDTSWAVGGEIGYGLSDNSEVFGTLRYTSASGGGVEFGRLQNVETVEVTPVNADFDDHEVWTMDVGYRYYFGEGPRWKPYVAGRVGAAYTSGISASFSTPGGAFAANDVTFYDDSWSWTFGGDLGVNYQASDRFAIQAEVGLRYISDLSDESGPGLINFGLADLNSDSGSSISAPLMIRGKYSW